MRLKILEGKHAGNIGKCVRVEGDRQWIRLENGETVEMPRYQIGMIENLDFKPIMNQKESEPNET